MPFQLVMRRLLFIIIAVISFSANAKENETVQKMPLTPIQVNNLLNEVLPNLTDIPDLVEREEKIAVCVDEYIKKQSKSYAKMAQENLYNLMHNFDRVASVIYGKKVLPDDIPFDEKIEALARVQCNAYYTMGVLK